jgi:hypothetical protein
MISRLRLAAALFTMTTFVTAVAFTGPAVGAVRTQVGTTPTTATATTVETPTTNAPVTTVAPATTPPTTSELTTPTTTSATTAPAANTDTTSDDSSTPWGLIIAIAALAVIALIVFLIVRARAGGAAKRSWNAAAASALRDADLTRDMLAGEARPGEPEDAARHHAVNDNVERVSARFEQLAAQAPDEEAHRQAAAVASSLRGYLFALEAERLLRDAPTPPTADQLASADATRRARADELERALAAMRQRTDTAPGR